MPRNLMDISDYGQGIARLPGRAAPLHEEWGLIVGRRIRRLRKARGLSLEQLAAQVPKPGGGHWHRSHFSRIERGWVAAPFAAWIRIANVLEVRPGDLLGEDDATKPVAEGQRSVLRFVESEGLSTEEAIARLARER